MVVVLPITLTYSSVSDFIYELNQKEKDDKDTNICISATQLCQHLDASGSRDTQAVV
ncbi:hypothetical protein A1F99_003200 [Pyrenophora tritici-repentis]|nr:hypothetical protein A1F99_003200 [Pyrenophora tritici-repentis]